MTLVIILMSLFGLPALGAGPTTLGCPQEERAVYEVVQLVPLIPEQPSHTQENYTFFSQRVTVHYHEGQRVLLSSTPDGAGLPSGDDVFWMQAQPSGQVWERDFRDPTRTKIVPIAPQWVTHLFTPGVNELAVSLQDRTPPVYGSQPWFLLLVSCVPQTVSPSPSPSPRPTDPPTAIPTTPPTPPPSVTPSATPVPTATATPTPHASVVLLPIVHTADPVGTLVAPPRWGLNLYRWVIAVGGLVAGMVLWRRKNRWRTRGEDTVKIYEDGKHLRSVILAKVRRNPVTFGPNSHIPLDIDPALLISRVQVRKQQGSDGRPEVLLEYLSEADPGSGGQSGGRHMRVVQTQKLRHGDEFTVGKYTLVYQHYA